MSYNILILIEYSLHRHMKDSLKKNLSLYLLIEIWFMISLIMWVYIEFDKLRCFSQAPLVTTLVRAQVAILGKGLRRSKGLVQLVKYRDIE